MSSAWHAWTMVGVLALVGCGARTKASLAYSGSDARAMSGPLAATIADRGFAPVCREGKFCKFEVSSGVTVHFKLNKKGPTLVIDVPPDANEAAKEEMERDAREVAQEIWKQASPLALAAEAKADAREKEEQARDDERYRYNTEKRMELERVASEERVRIAEANALGSQPSGAKDAAAGPTAEITSAPRARGSAIRVDEPEAAHCTVTGDNDAAPRSLEIPFQIEAVRGSFYTLDCELEAGARWRKKIEAVDRAVTVVRLRAGGA